MWLPVTLAMQTLRQAHPKCMKLLATIAALDAQQVPYYLLEEINSDFTESRIEFLQKLALVDVNRDDPKKKWWHVKMHGFVQDAVFASHSAAAWAAHIKETILTLCHTFMTTNRDRIDGLELYSNSKALSTQLDAIRGSEHAVVYVSNELDTFAQFLHSHHWSPELLRKQVNIVFERVVRGDFNEFCAAVYYVNRPRGGPGAFGSMPQYWYADNKHQIQDYRYD